MATEKLGAETEVLKKKRLLYTSLYRGHRETDILLGKFARSKLDSFNTEQLLLYEEFLSLDEVLVYNYLIGAIQAADKFRPIIDLIKDFNSAHLITDR